MIQPRPGSKKAKSANVELTRLGSLLRTLGGLGGTALGGMVGMGATGGNFGTGLGASLSRWLGSGDYTVSSNSITQKASAGTIPAMHQQGQSIIVRHREFLTEVRGSTTFLVRNEFNLNPGLSNTFPWLSGIANQYSQYKIKGMVFHYVPTSGNIAAASPALGTVMIQTSYRATEAAATSKVEMLNEYWSSEAKPSDEFCHPIECDPKENPFNIQYVRSGSLPATENQLMYDLGTTRIAVSGQQTSNLVLGDLWVTYEIELKKPVVTNLTNDDIQTMTFSANAGITSIATVGTNPAVVFNSFNGTFTFGANTIIFPLGTVGEYQLTYYFQNVTLASTPSIGATNCTPLATVNGAFQTGSDYTVGTGQCMATIYIRIADPSLVAQVQLSFAFLVGATNVRCMITEFNGSATIP